MTMEYTLEDINNDALVEDFLDRNIAENTKRFHITALKDYCNYIQKLPTALIEEAEEEQDNNVKIKHRKIKKYFNSYIKDLKKRGKSINTVRSYVISVKAFYGDNEIIIPPKISTKPNKDEVIQRGISELPTLEDVKRLVFRAGIRDKALILLHLSSGMGLSEVSHLTYSDFLKSQNLPVKRRVDIEETVEILESREDEDLIGCWSIHRYKTGYYFTTFNSPESTRAIIQYLIHRNRENKQIRSNSDFLFVNQYNKFLRPNPYSLIFLRLNEKVGFERRAENNRHFITSHQLRELFSSTLFKKGVDRLKIDFFLGHKINDQNAAYFRSNPEDLKEQYLKALPEITLEKVKVKRIESEEVREIVNKLNAAEARADLNDEKLSQIEDIIDKTSWMFEAAKTDKGVREALKKYRGKMLDHD
ncbi:MAG: site-specific tyrosine recombinase XerC [Candidatus Methanofastidiosum methylothiophilum]|uniref:Site-specific tyrosine recombinase XerC n=1 Tax=Candidatus Methanofastidiosum methylothiophilum TaxID=1705564 RepID=A0A150JA82_9EURY|nr:MAG: site-specific tyrosine recombinase XerC [Candidatus Methanofastidiosum methylthiophilus]